MRNIKLILAYDGTLYHGWQRQENAITIQELVEKALYKVTNEKIAVEGCGRTDAGVHAKRFVCNFKAETKIPSEKIPYAINAYLPKDIVCLEAADESEDFHAKFSAVKKTYTYYICNEKFPDVFSHSWHYPYTLNLDKMRKAAEAFIGTHDFLGFAAAGFTVKTTVRTIYDLKITKENNLIRIDVTGNGFLYNMVRIIAGTLCFVGSGKIDYKEMPQIIASCDRKRAGITAPPDGLFLTEVYYEE